MDTETKPKKIKLPKKKNAVPSKFMKYKNKIRKNSLDEIESLINSNSEQEEKTKKPKSTEKKLQ
jgi:hypothetical protein